MQQKPKSRGRVLYAVLILSVTTMNAQAKEHDLNARERSIVAVSALTATGDIEKLKIQLNVALDAGLTINEINEVLVQLYAYCGFPRSLNALGAFMNVVEQRKKDKKTDALGRAPSPLPKNKTLLELGTAVQTKLVGQSVSGGVMSFSPAIDRYLKEHLFGAIFSSDVLTHQQRELVTIAALASMDGVEAQLQSHITMGMNTGITTSQIVQVFDLIKKHIGKVQAERARQILSKTAHKK